MSIPATPQGAKTTERAAAGVSLGIGVLGLLPFAWVLGLTPMSRDAAIWLERSSWSYPKRLEWLFDTQHFNVGYRPVTGLSYLLNDSLGGAMGLYRATDFALHLSGVVLLHGLIRRWAPRTSPWAATAGAAVLALHPIISIVVPHLARRGYSLATALSLLGLWLLGRGRRGTDALAILAMCMGAMSNEAAYVAIPIAAFVLLQRGPTGRMPLLGLGGALAAILALRVAVIGGIGGYQTAQRTANMGTVALATWSALLPLGPPQGPGESVLPSTPLVAITVALAAALLAAAGRAWAHRDELPVAWAAAWLLGITLVYLPNGVWFPRQVYMLVAPLGLLVGLALGHALLDKGRQRWLRAAPAAAVLAAVVNHMVIALPTQRQAWEATDRTTRQLIAAGGEVPRRADVWTVVPFAQRGGRAALKAREGDARRHDEPLGARISPKWAAVALHRRRFLVVGLAFHPTDVSPPFFEVQPMEGGWRLVPAPGVVWSVDEAHEAALQGDHLLLLPPEGTRVYVDDGVQGRMLKR